MKKLNGCFNKRMYGYARKAVIYLLITAVLLPLFIVPKAYALPEGLSVTKTVERDVYIAGGGAPGYTQIYPGDETVADTNVLRYSNVMTNSSDSPITVDLKAEMPTNTILFFSDEWYDANDDGRMVTGISPLWGSGVSDSYTAVSYAWFYDTGLNEYNRSIAAATTSGVGAHALEGPHTLTLDNVTILAGESYTFEYAVIVWADGLTGYEITDNFTIDSDPTTPFTLYCFAPNMSMTSDVSGTAFVGGDVTYTLNMKSVGTQAVMELEIPAGTTYKADSLATTNVPLPSNPDVSSDKISFTLLGVPLNDEFTVCYTVTVNSGATTVNNSQTKVNGTPFNSVSLNVASGDVTATGYAANILPSRGIVAGQKITYTAEVYSTAGVPTDAVVSVDIPAGAEFVSSTSGVYDSVGGQIIFTIASLDTAHVPLDFTLRLKDGATGDLALHFDGMGTPPEWKHPILVVTKILKKDTTIAGDTLNDKLPSYSAIADGSAVEYQDLILIVNSVENTGTIPVYTLNLSAPTPENMALYITYKEGDDAFEDASYGTTTGVSSEYDYPLLHNYDDLAYVWATRPEASTFTDYERSVEAQENALEIDGAYYAPFIVYKDNLFLAPGGVCDLRYAVFVNSDIIGAEFYDDFKVNGIPTKPLRLLIPGYTIDSTPVPFSSVLLNGEITYTFTMPASPTVFSADIPTGTELVSASATTSTGEPVTVTDSVDKITINVPEGEGTRRVSYTVRLARPVTVIVNNININNKYFGTISHKMSSTTEPEGVVLGYIFTSDPNNSYISYNSRMTFKYFVQNNTADDIKNVVITAPIDEYFRLDPRSVPYWFGGDAVIIAGGTVYDPYDLWFDYFFADPLDPVKLAAYDALGPFSVQWTIPLVKAGHTVSVLVNDTDPSSEISFSGNVKSEEEVPQDRSTLVQNASLEYDVVGGATGETKDAEKLLYYFPPRTFVVISSTQTSTSEKTPGGEIIAQNGPTYKHGDIITYTVDILSDEVDLDNALELFISSTIPAGTTLVPGSVEVFDGQNPMSEPDAFIDLINPGKVRVRVPDPESTEYKVTYSVKITSYTGLLQTYAIGQVFEDKQNTENGQFVRTVTAASETNILQHKFDTPMSKVTISNQSLVDSGGAELAAIPQSIGGSLQSLPVDFVITFTDLSGNEYNVVMQNGDTNLVLYGLPYDVPITVTEIGTSDTFLREITDSSGGVGGVISSGGSYSFTLRDNPAERNISFSIVSEYRTTGGFSSAASRNNPFEIPNFDFTSLLKYQLQDLASTQLDNGTGDGAIPISDDALSYRFAEQRFSIRPYFSMTVANAFLLDEAYYENAKRYIEWHIAHLNEVDVYGVPGSIYDYYYSILGDEQRAYTMAESSDTVDVYDSTDSYAALFFELVLNYYEVTGDDSFIEKEILDHVLSCLVASLSENPKIVSDAEGALLTVAKPGNYPMEFLMDNCEVYRGFLCLIKLYQIIGNTDSAGDAAYYADKIKLGIETYLYNVDDPGNPAGYDNGRYIGGTYDYALGNPSEIETYYYPDAIAQMFPIIFDIVEPTNPVAIKLYDDFTANFLYWTDMKNLYRPGYADKINRGGGASEFPNALLLKAAIKMDDLEGASIALKNIETLFRQNGNPFPFLCFESGETALCISMFMDAYYEMCRPVFTRVQKFEDGY